MEYTRDWLIRQTESEARIKYLFFWGINPRVMEPLVHLASVNGGLIIRLMKEILPTSRPNII